jgi:N6-L-threonylcarbamoyladenine synthase
MEQSPGKGLILGIESSCDETAAAVVQRGAQALSNVVASQIALHAAFGGVVPELASREHLRSIVPVVRAAMEHANAGFDDLDGIAVTEGPGLAGALLVGILYAKALAFGLGKPLLAVNHLEGHIHAVLMEARSRGEAFQDFPLLALVVSGGHTHLFLAEAREGTWSYRNVGRTVDDAAGEAYDKVAKLLGLGYPGGPWMDALAAFGDPAAVRFNFSFSGIKTAVLRYVEMHGMKPGIEARRLALADGANLKPEQARDLCDGRTLDLIASFQAAVVGVLLRQALAAAQAFGVRGVLVSGGVAANRELRRRFEAEAAALGLPMAFPSIALSTDNAAMIAAAAWPKLQAGQIAPESMSAEPQLRLGT